MGVLKNVACSPAKGLASFSGFSDKQCFSRVSKEEGRTPSRLKEGRLPKAKQREEHRRRVSGKERREKGDRK